MATTQIAVAALLAQAFLRLTAHAIYSQAMVPMAPRMNR
jgi:hypothetical protein